MSCVLRNGLRRDACDRAFSRKILLVSSIGEPDLVGIVDCVLGSGDRKRMKKTPYFVV